MHHDHVPLHHAHGPSLEKNRLYDDARGNCMHHDHVPLYHAHGQNLEKNRIYDDACGNCMLHGHIKINPPSQHLLQKVL